MKKFVLLSILCLAPALLCAQEKKTPEQMEKEFYEAIEKQIDRLTTLLDLDDAQVFYVDSILTHDYNALKDEINNLAQSKISNPDIYAEVQDKWAEQIYTSFHGVFRQEQWTKYLKSGAEKEKRARDKRAAKKK